MKQNVMRRFFVSLFLLLAVLVAGTSVQAASVAKTNKKADKAFDAKLAALRTESAFPLSYAYVDLTGDGIHEALVEHRPSGIGGSGSTFAVFAYEKGAVKQLLSIDEYGLTKCTYYTKTKTLIAYGAGHGGEWYRAYQLKSNKYKAIAQKTRTAKAGGAAENGPWKYTKGKSETQTTKSKYTSLMEKLKKGKKKTVSSFKTFS